MDYNEKEKQILFPCQECEEDIPVWEYKSYFGKCQYCAEEKLKHALYDFDNEEKENEEDYLQ